MNLSIQDIYDRVESVKTFHGYSQDKMAELMGLSNKQAYSNMIKKKTMKLKYLVNLANNSGESIDKFFTKSTKEQLYKNFDNVTESTEPEIKYFSCPDCIKKQKEIDELLEYRQKYIECLEELAGKKKAI